MPILIFFTSRRNATFWPKVGETGVGEMGVGEQGPVPLKRGKISWHVRSSVIKTFIWSYKLVRCETKIYMPRKRDRERFYMVKFYLGKWFWSIQYRFAGNAYLSIVVYSVFGFSRWQRSATPELLWYIRSLKAAAPSWLALCLYFQALRRNRGE